MYFTIQPLGVGLYINCRLSQQASAPQGIGNIDWIKNKSLSDKTHFSASATEKLLSENSSLEEKVW